MEMKFIKTVKRLTTIKYFLIFILLTNFVTWLFIGRETILLKSAEEFRVQNKCFADTIYIPINSNKISKKNEKYKIYFSTFSDFRNITKSNFLNEMYHHSNYFKTINYIGEKKIRVNRNCCIYDILILRNIPLFSYLSTKVIAGRESVGYSKIYIWLFTWIRVNNKMRWQS